MATFSVVSDAVRCAIAIQLTAPRGVVEPPLKVRAGLNVGEVLRQEMGSGYFGTPLVIARRLCDQAVAGQILCSGTVAGLTAGSPGLRFRELGKCQLKGIAEPLLVSEVTLEEAPLSSRSFHELRAFLQTLPDIVVATDQMGLVVFFNQGAEEVLGYSSDEILGRHVMELYPSSEEAKRVMAAVRDPSRDGPGRVSTFPTTFLTKSGREVPALISVALVEAKARAGTIGVARVHRPT
jgi:PAS domain S-box-containing protein